MPPPPLLTLIVLATGTVPPPPDVLTVVAVAEPPSGPSVELAELAHQLRGACRDRARGIQDVSEVRARLLGDAVSATLPDLERAYVGAQAAYQADEIDSAVRTLRALVDDLESLPESAEAYALWLRAQLRIALAERTSKHPAEMAAAIERILALEPSFTVDARQYAPSFRREFEEVRRRAAQRPRRRLTVVSNAAPVTAFVEGKPIGTTPAVVVLPPGRYRVGGALGRIRAPGTRVALDREDVRVELDAALAEAVRPDAGPGLALPASERAVALVRTGSWLGADRIVAAGVVAEGEARFLSGAVYDVRRGTLLREGRVGVAGGAAPSPDLGPLAAFLLTGQPAPGVTVVAPQPPASAVAGAMAPLGARPGARSGSGAGTESLLPRSAPGPIEVEARAPRPAWLRPAAYASGALALGLAGLATQQALASRGGYRDASALLRPDGALVPGADRARYDQTVAGADAARRNAYLAAGGTVVLAGVAGVLGYLAWDSRGAAVRF